MTRALLAKAFRDSWLLLACLAALAGVGATPAYALGGHVHAVSAATRRGR